MKTIEEHPPRKRGTPSPCPICNMMIRSDYGMSCHLRRHNNDKPFQCDKCSKAFIIRSELTKHGAVHSDERPFKCETCNGSFKKFQALKMHLLKYCRKTEYVCSMCDKSFQGIKRLRLHEQIDHCCIDLSYLECGVCSETFMKEEMKDKHEEVVHGIVFEKKNCKPIMKSEDCKPIRKRARGRRTEKLHLTRDPLTDNHSETSDRKWFPCKICLERFSFQSDQIKHYKELHADVYDMFFKTCEICGKVLNSQYYDDHKKAHHDSTFYPFECSVCDYKSIRMQDIQNHMRVHTKEFPYKCKTCLMLYRSKKQLSTCERKHTGVKNVKCDQCARLFFSVADLTLHRSQFHTMHKCSYCNYETLKRRDFHKHNLSVHNVEIRKNPGKSYVCEKCGSSYGSQASLTIHLKRHLLKNVNWTERMKRIRRCLYCDFIGDSAEELLKHGLKYHYSNMFKCEKCPYVTYHTNNFRRHTNMHIRTAPTGRPRGRPRKNDSVEVFLGLKEQNPTKTDECADVECFLCGFLTNFPDVMKSHLQTHDNFIQKFSSSLPSKDYFKFFSDVVTSSQIRNDYKLKHFNNVTSSQSPNKSKLKAKHTSRSAHTKDQSNFEKFENSKNERNTLVEFDETEEELNRPITSSVKVKFKDTEDSELLEEDISDEMAIGDKVYRIYTW